MKVKVFLQLALLATAVSAGLDGRRIKGTSVKGVYGIQKDCFKNDKKKFNICLDLNTINDADRDPNAKSTFIRCYPLQVWFTISSTQLLSQDICEKEVPYAPGKEGAVYNAKWMNAAIDAKNVIEGLIVKDTVDQFFLERAYKKNTTVLFDPDSTDFLQYLTPDGTVVPLTTNRDPKLAVDDVFITITADFIDSASVVAVTFLNLDSWFQNPKKEIFNVECSIKLGAGFSSLMENNNMVGLLIHEMIHCLGLAQSHVSKYFQDLVGTYHDECLDKSYPIWTGKAALRQWNKLGCDGPIPLEPVDILHLNSGCFPQVFNFVKGFFDLSNPLAQKVDAITAGMLADIGYTIDFSQVADISLDDLGGKACGNACPKVSKCEERTKIRRERGLYQAKETSKNSTYRKGGRRLDPMAIIPSFTPTPSPDPYTDSFMRFVNDMGLKRNETVLTGLMRGANDELFSLRTTVAEAADYVMNNPVIGFNV